VIDIKLLRDNPDAVRASQRSRGEDEGVVDAIRAADERRRSSLTAFEQLRAEQKTMGKDVARAQGDEKQALLARTKEIAAQVKALQADADEAQVELDTLLRTIGNVVERRAERRRGRLRRARDRRHPPGLRCRGLRAP
jgi:seryl-tRNA synthetase